MNMASFGMFLSVALLLVAAIPANLGISYFLREKHSNLRVSLLFLGISAAVWSFGYGMIGITETIEQAQIFRMIGLAGVDGKIEVNSVYGQGSTFTVILPLRSGLEMKDDGNILDTKLGLAYCGDSMELYIRILRLTVHYADEKRRLLADAFGKDQELYLRLIYSMKSNALNVGAKKLSDAAAEMQKLVNRMQKEDTDPYLVSRHQNMLEVFDETIYRSKRLLND